MTAKAMPTTKSMATRSSAASKSARSDQAYDQAIQPEQGKVHPGRTTGLHDVADDGAAAGLRIRIISREASTAISRGMP